MAMVAANRPSLDKASLDAKSGQGRNKREESMRSACAFAVAMLALTTICTAAYAAEPKQGGIFRIYHRDSPGSASIHEGATYSVNIPFMPVFNNLVVYNQNVAQNSMESIVPDLAESWAWSEDQKTLTFKLRQGVKWHDGKPFTSAHVKCTFDMLMGKSQQKFRQNPRKSWYDQVADVTTTGDFEASFNLKRPEPALLALINVATNIIVNSSNPPFDNLDIRRALALALDRKAFISILFEGQAEIGGSMQPAPEGLWAMPKEMMETIPGYGPDIDANREEARKLMQKAGYGPDKHLQIKISTRNSPRYRDPAVILIDQLKTIYIDAELEVVDTAQWFPKVARKDYALGLNLTGNAVDDPDHAFYENYSCGSERNYTNYCNKEIEKLFDQQSVETDVAKRKKMVWDIDKKLQEDVARPIIFHSRTGSCWQPYVRGITIMVNSSYNGYRYEDVWMDK